MKTAPNPIGDFEIHTRALRTPKLHIHDHTSGTFPHPLHDILVRHHHVALTKDDKEHSRYHASRTRSHPVDPITKIIIDCPLIRKIHPPLNHQHTPVSPSSRFHEVVDRVLFHVIDLDPPTHTMRFQIRPHGHHTRTNLCTRRKIRRTQFVEINQVIDSHHVARQTIVSSSNLGRLTPFVGHQLKPTVEDVPEHVQPRIVSRS